MTSSSESSHLNAWRAMRRRDLLVEVQGYDLERGVMLAADLKSGRKLEVTIESALPVHTDKPWSGNRVDARMAQNLPAGTHVVIEAVQGPQGRVRKDMPLAVSGRWVNRLPSPRRQPGSGLLGCG